MEHCIVIQSSLQKRQDDFENESKGENYYLLARIDQGHLEYKV